MGKAILVFTCKELADHNSARVVAHWRVLPGGKTERLPGGRSHTGRSRIFRGDYVRLDDDHGRKRFVGVSPSGVIWLEHTDTEAQFLAMCEAFDASFDVEHVPAPEWPTWKSYRLHKGLRVSPIYPDQPDDGHEVTEWFVHHPFGNEDIDDGGVPLDVAISDWDWQGWLSKKGKAQLSELLDCVDKGWA
jgi:hypothetical protein